MVDKRAFREPKIQAIFQIMNNGHALFLSSLLICSEVIWEVLTSKVHSRPGQGNLQGRICYSSGHHELPGEKLGSL